MLALHAEKLKLGKFAVVLESGTGSGSLTHCLARAVAPTGQVLTFEFHAQRAKEAEQEFSRHGLDGLVEVRERDVEKLGFPEDLHGTADAVFLDLPGPWRVRQALYAFKWCLRTSNIASQYVILPIT